MSKLYLVPLEDRVVPAFVFNLTGNTLNITGDSSGEAMTLATELTPGPDAGKLTHSYSGVNGLFNQYDLDPVTPNEQSHSVSGLTINFNGGGGSDTLYLYNLATAASFTNLANFYWYATDPLLANANVTLTNNSMTVNGVTTPFSYGISGTTFAQLAEQTDAGGDNVIDASMYTNGSVYIYGGKGNDTLTGSSNVANGDIIYGGEGNDTLNGGPGGDTLNGDDGNDTLNGGDGNDTLNGGDGSNSLSGGNGDDTLYSHYNGGTGADIVDGGNNFDYLYANAVSSLVASDGAITLNGSIPGANNFEYIQAGGTAGNDTMNIASWTGGYAYLYGGDGNDILTGGPGNDSLIGQGGNDTLHGNGGNDNLYGDDGDNILNGNAGGDTIYSHYFGGTGADVVDGGTDADYLYAYSVSTITVTDSSITINGGTAGLNNLEYVQAVGTPGNDTMNSAAWTLGYVYFYGEAGNDTLTGGPGNDNLAGGADNDTLTGNGGIDSIHGDDGNNTIDGGSGVDYLYSHYFGGTGGDIVNGGDDNDYLYANNVASLVVGNGSITINGGPAGANNLEFIEANGTSGNDTMDASTWTGGYVNFYGQDGNDTLKGGTGNDNLLGQNGDDQLFGHVGTDSLNGGAGFDAIDGGPDDDSIFTNDNDTINGGQGKDYLYASAISNLVVADGSISINGGPAGLNNLEYIQAVGTSGNDTMDASAWTGGQIDFYGYEGNDILRGGSGNDSIQGGDGNDTLSGGAGVDSLSGQADNDTISDGGAESNFLYGDSGTDAIIYLATAGNDAIDVSYNTIVVNGQSAYFNDFEDLTFDAGAGVDHGTQTGNMQGYFFNNLEPTVSAGPNETSNSIPFIRTGCSFTDIGGGQSWTGMVDYGEGAGFEAIAVNQVTKTFNLNHAYSSGGTFIVTCRIIDNQGNIGEDTFEVRYPAGIQIGIAGGIQRSMVEQVVVTFDAPMTLNPGWYLFEKLTPGFMPTIGVTVTNPGINETRAELTFSGAGMDGTSLEDGNYRLTLFGANIINNNTGLNFDGDGDNAPGGNFIFDFHRFFGDGNGDHTTDTTDFVLFGGTFNTSIGYTGYSGAFNGNGDTIVDTQDFVKFGNYFNRTLL